MEFTLKNIIRIGSPYIIALAGLSFFPGTASGQDKEEIGVEDSRLVITPLFEYPVAPEEMTDLQAKTGWLMDHFWDSMDFSTKQSVDQNALNDAFQVYGAAAIHAPKSKVLKSVNSLVKSIKGNPVLLLQFAKGAEEAFYGPRAVGWSDEIYMPFVEAVVADKSISDSRKIRYKAILDNMKRNAIGVKFPKLRLTLRNGRHQDFTPENEYTLIEVGNPDCDDCKFAKMKLDMASDIREMIADKKIGMVFLVADAVPEEEAEILSHFQSYPQDWLTGISYGADDLLDLRATPSFYVLGKKGEILAKNLDVDAAVETIRSLVKL
ncbi:MAG: DUF5106 domain-containing protein [Muribaculaceae bacterium]|nr:DUF5106 domain-containing protein [Muribaculaceae bacterium]